MEKKQNTVAVEKKKKGEIEGFDDKDRAFRCRVPPFANDCSFFVI